MSKFNRDEKSVINSFMGEPEETGRVDALEQTETPQGEETVSPFNGIVFHPKKSTKSERIQLMMTPELKKALKKEAAKNKTSVNELVNVVMSAYVKASNGKE